LFCWTRLSNDLRRHGSLFVRESDLSIWKRWGAERSAHPFVHGGFQSREPTLEGMFPLLEERQCELSQVFLKRSHLGFQAGKLLDQVSLLREGGGHRRRCLKVRRFAFLRGRSLSLKHTQHRSCFWEGRGCGGKGLERTTMQPGQLLDVF
jgi:hypothetical protein